MTILWCGGEDVDFIQGIPTYHGSGDMSFVRYGLAHSQYSGGPLLSKIFTPVSSCWYSFRVMNNGAGVNNLGIGLCKSSTLSYIGVGSGSASLKTALLKYDGTTITKLAEEDGASMTNQGYDKIDVNILSYSTNGLVNIYVNGVLRISYSGDVTVLGQSLLDQVSFIKTWDQYGFVVYEVIVADEDTRLMRLKTLAPNDDGDTSANWTGTYQDIDETTISDSDKITSATDNADFQCNLTGMPTDTFSVKAVKLAARCVDGSAAMGIQTGVKTNGTVSVSGTQECSGYWQTKELLLNTNPVTGNPWTPAEINALQINLRAKAL